MELRSKSPAIYCFIRGKSVDCLRSNQSRSGSFKGKHVILVIVLIADGRLDAAGLTVRVSSSKTWAELTDWEPTACVLTSGKFQQNVDQTSKSKRSCEYTTRPVLMTVFQVT